MECDMEEMKTPWRAKLSSPRLPLRPSSANERAALRVKDQQLRRKGEQLRRKEEQLRRKEEQLRTKEEQLLTEKHESLRTGPEAYLKRALLMGPPSQTSLKREQLDPTSGPLIRNWRPSAETAAGLLPELIHPVFARAADLMAGTTDLDQATMDTAGKLCCIGARFYENEAGPNEAVRDELQRYLEFGDVVTISSGFAANNVSPDLAMGDKSKDPTYLFMVYEGKPGIGGCGDPHFQGANYLLHFWRERADTDAFRNTCCPAFLLEVVGPHVRLSAMAWLDRVTIFPLTPLLNLLPAHPVTDSLLMPVARMVAALRAGVHELAQAHAAAQHAAAQQQVVKELALPWPIGMDPRYDAASAVQLSARNPTYYVPLAGGGGGSGVEAVAVKLCRKYGLAAHVAWADLGLAPQVLRAEPLPGGWQLVEMEWLSKHEWRRLSDLARGELDQALSAVEQALAFAHSATDMVHGDVRPPNCLVRCYDKKAGSWDVRFLDFEWAGRVGEATYPACLNPEIPWPEGVGYGKQLQCAHDLQLLVASTAGCAAGDGRGPAGPGAVRSLRTAARDRCAVPMRKAAGVVLHRGVGVGWRQGAAAGWLRPAAPGRRLVW